MSPILIELSPNRLLLDSNFDGYKLSLQEIPCKKLELLEPIDRILLTPSQYTLLHAKLYGLHNHLIGDPFDENDSVYFIDNQWNVCKTYLDPFTEELINPVKAWQIPKNNDRNVGDFNVSLKFVNKNIAVIADGTGFMYILNTDSRSDDNIFTLLFSDKVVGQDEGFIIIDAVYKVEIHKDQLHVLLLNLKQDNLDERFSVVLHWISFSKSADGSWQQDAIKQLKTDDIQYAALERDCGAVYVVTDSGCKFILNSDNPITGDDENTDTNSITKTYQWTQNEEDITIKFPLENIEKELVFVETKPTEIEIKYNGNNLLCGHLHHIIDSEGTTWTIEKDHLQVIINKRETGLMWPEVVNGNLAGEYVIDTCIAQEVHERLAHLCSNTEVTPQSGMTFNSQQVEECDFESDKSIVFERLNGRTNKITHKIHLGSHQVLLTVSLSTDLPPALGIRHDVDVCLWQPQGSGDDFSISHEGTLLAFGYVQASKQNRKFSVCAPDMSYSAICESTRHLFIYRQKKPVSSGELRNRTTRRQVHTTAQQQVVNVSNDEIIGIYASNATLFLLCETSVIALKV